MYDFESLKLLAKQYLKYEDDDPLVLELCIESAAGTIRNAVGQRVSFDGKQNTLARLALCLLTAHYYENREIYQIGGRTMNDIPFSLNNILFQLKYSEGSNERGKTEQENKTL